jgi:hypothetical protein
MSKSSPPHVAARRSAETVLSQSRKRQEGFKNKQQLAMVEKTAQLRELRLAKEAADKEAETANATATASVGLEDAGRILPHKKY